MPGSNVNVRAFCGYCTSAIIIFCLYIPGIIILLVYSGETADVGSVIVAVGLIAFFVAVHGILPCVCCYTELPDTRYKIIGYLALQIAIMIWNLVAFIYIICTIYANEDEVPIPDETKRLGLTVASVMMATAVGVIVAPIVVFVLAKVTNLVCSEPCRKLHKMWRLRKAVHEYEPLNQSIYKSTL